jgi:cell division protease FtsH
MKKNTQFHIGYWIAAAIGLLLFRYLAAMSQQVAELPYSEFETYLKDGKIAEVAVSDNYLQGTFKQPLATGETRFVTTRVDPGFAKQLQDSGVKFTGRIESNLLGNLLSWVVPIALFFGLWYFLMKRMGAGAGGLMQIGKSRAKVYVETDIKVTFDDVAGVDEAVDELREIVEFLRNPVEYGRLGGKMPKGVLLVGPPGTGKTLIARAVAGAVQGAVLFNLRIGIRRNVRRRWRGQGPRSL